MSIQCFSKKLSTSLTSFLKKLTIYFVIKRQMLEEVFNLIFIIVDEINNIGTGLYLFVPGNSNFVPF